MQHIGLIITGEDGKLIDQSNINFAEILSYVSSLNNSIDFPWISTIDPYGMTVYNGKQIPKFVADLEKLKRISPKISKAINETIAYTAKVKDFQLLNFIGD